MSTKFGVDSSRLYFARKRGAKYCATMFACLYARISLKPPNFGGIVICYVLRILWMTSCFHIMGSMVRYVYSKATKA